MTYLTTMVNTRGKRLKVPEFHRCLKSSEWFFLMTMARRKGETIAKVISPQKALPHQWPSK